MPPRFADNILIFAFMFEDLKLGKYPSDSVFDAIYPKKYQEHSARHFTPVRIAIEAAKFLAQSPSDQVLDIGSGSGKFCMVGAMFSEGHFYGVEMRKTLINLSNRIKRTQRLKTAHFIHSDFTALDFSKYQGIYFFNAFHEFYDASCVLDETSQVSLEDYKRYHSDLKRKLQECLPGTRLVTYHTFKNRIPSSFRFIRANKTGLLKFYIKK